MRKDGYIALTVVLLIIPILLLAGMTLLYQNMDLLYANSNFIEGELTKAQSYTCVEEAVRKLKLDNTLVGNFTTTSGELECNMTISNISGNNVKKVLLIVQRNGYYKNLGFNIDLTTQPFTFTYL